MEPRAIRFQHHRQERNITADGKSLGNINEMMKEIRELITSTRGIGTRYMQGYLNFNILRKQMKYKYKRNEMAEKILEEVQKTSAFKNEFVLAIPMPISLKKAYYEYRYGIFAE